MGYSLIHLNPWEKINKTDFLRYLEDIDRKIADYERYSPLGKYLIPERIHNKIMALSEAINKAKDFYAYYQDARELYEVIDTLNKQDVFTDSVKAAKVYGRLFVVLGSIAMKNSNPLVKQYGQMVNTLGQKFERLESLINGTHGNEEYRNFDPHVGTR